MKKVALVFVLAVIVPSLLLAWLAVRSLRDQQFVSERQQSLLYQSVADALAKEAVGFLAERQREFNQQVETLLAGSAPRDAANSFDERLRQAWPWAEIGFVVSLEGSVLAPSLFASPEARKFRLENDRFLCSRETVDVYWNSPKGQINLTKLDQEKKLARADSEKSGPPGDKENEIDGDGKAVFATKSGKVPRAVTPQKDSPQEATSKVSAEETEFRQLVGDATEGTLARFLQNKLKVLIWHRSQRDPQLVF